MHKYQILKILLVSLGCLLILFSFSACQSPEPPDTGETDTETETKGTETQETENLYPDLPIEAFLPENDLLPDPEWEQKILSPPDEENRLDNGKFFVILRRKKVSEDKIYEFFREAKRLGSDMSYAECKTLLSESLLQRFRDNYIINPSDILTIGISLGSIWAFADEADIIRYAKCKDIISVEILAKEEAETYLAPLKPAND